MKAKKTTKATAVRFSKSVPEESIGFLFWQVSHAWQRNINAALQSQNLTHAQFIMLASIAWLQRNGEEVTQVQVSQHAKTDVMMTSKVVRTLEEKNFITRKEHPADTRAKSVALTPAGKSVLQRALKTVEKIDTEFFSVLGGSTDTFRFHLNNIILANKEE